eukprot:COSAG01_NODE_494_length_16322_cov_35.380879_15_plen_201_part_00
MSNAIVNLGAPERQQRLLLPPQGVPLPRLRAALRRRPPPFINKRCLAAGRDAPTILHSLVRSPPVMNVASQMAEIPLHASAQVCVSGAHRDPRKRRGARNAALNRWRPSSEREPCVAAAATPSPFSGTSFVARTDVAEGNLSQNSCGNRSHPLELLVQPRHDLGERAVQQVRVRSRVQLRNRARARSARAHYATLLRRRG